MAHGLFPSVQESFPVRVSNDVFSLAKREVHELCQGLLLDCYLPLGAERMEYKQRVVIAPMVKEPSDKGANPGDIGRKALDIECARPKDGDCRAGWLEPALFERLGAARLKERHLLDSDDRLRCRVELA
jgi:hypothetical protein